MKKINLPPIFTTQSFAVLFTITLLTLFAFSKSPFQSPTVSVAADKMNLFYIGIDNPITVAVEGVLSSDLKVTCEDGEVDVLGNGHFNVRVFEPGKKKVTVIADGVTTREIIYRVKRIPDPTARLWASKGGSIWAGTFKKETKIIVDNYMPIEEDCVVDQFSITRQRGKGDPEEIINQGGAFSAKTLELVSSAQEGDVYYFDRITCKCPGDPASRKINAMVFKIR